MRLRRDHQADGEDPPAQLDLLGEAPRRERRHRDAVADSLLRGRARKLEGHRRGEQPRLRGERVRGPGDRPHPPEVEPLALGEPAGQARERWLQQLQRALGRCRQRRGERDPHEIDRCGERQHLVAPRREDSLLAGEHDRVVVMRVQLDRERRQRVAERVARGAADLHDAAVGERVLEVARRARRPQIAALERRPQALELGGDARVGAQRRDRRVKRRDVRRERLEVERRGHGHRVHERLRVGERERAQRGRERAVVDQREGLLRRELDVREELVGEVAERREVGHAGRPEHPHARVRAVVERVNESLGEQRANARRPLGKAVEQPQHRRPHRVGRRRRPVADAVVVDQRAIEAGAVGRRDAVALARTKSRGHPVDRVALLERALDDLAGSVHPLRRAGRELDALARAGHAHHLLERETLAVHDDAHRSRG